MKFRFKIGIILLFFASIIILTFACLDSSQACHDDAACPHNPPIFRTGISLPLTGVFEVVGKSMRKGYELWAEEINAKGIAGNKIKLIIEDNESNINKAVSNLKKFIEHNAVDMVFGMPSYGAPSVVSTIVNKEQYPIIIPSLISAEKFEYIRQPRYSYYASMLFSPAENFIMAAGEIANNLKVKKAAFVVENGFIEIPNLEEIIESKGLEIALLEHIPSDTKDFASIANKVANVKAQAIFFLNNNFYSGASFTNEIKGLKQNFKVRMLLVNRIDKKYINNLPDNLLEGVITRVEWHEKLNTPNNKSFVEKYKKMYSELPNQFSASAYAMGEIYEKALTEIFTSKEKIYLHNAIRQLNTSSIIGAFKVGAFGIQEGHKHLLVQWQNGEEQIVWPSELSTADLRN